ncbi:MAG: aconitase X catalytic domain-containing protein [Thermoproteales archaeon]|nr:aconitase X catalytic domain-containing protein [Thermoproteales archaeon]
MLLTDEEARLLRGEAGEGVAEAMEVVVRVAEAIGAERLVKISRAHISGISFRNLGEEGIEFIEEMARKGLRFAVPTTVNPAGMDMENWRRMGVNAWEYEAQARVLRALEAMGAEITLSCTPYLYSPPRYGEHVAWAESNAVLYANSVLGARTNREGGPLALFEAIVGRAPYAGLHTDEGRAPTIAVDLSPVKRLGEEGGYYSALGYLVGSVAKTGVPLLLNTPSGLSTSCNLKLFLAAVGASSSVGLALIEGISPEFRRVEGLDTVALEPHQLVEVLEKWGEVDVDAVVLGCPHLSPQELVELYNRLRGRRLLRRLLLFTSRWAASRATHAVRGLKEVGAEVYVDTCMVVGDLRRMGVESCATDSAKAAYYLTNQGYRVWLAPRDALLEAVTA